MNARISVSSMANLLTLFAGNAAARSFDSMPECRPQHHVSGIIRVAGDYHEKPMLANREQEFHKYQLDLIFHNNLTSRVHSIPALVFDAADVGLLGREIAPLEDPVVPPDVQLRAVRDCDCHRQLRHAIPSLRDRGVCQQREPDHEAHSAAARGHLRLRTGEEHQGQESFAKRNVFLPVTADTLSEQLKKLQ